MTRALGSLANVHHGDDSVRVLSFIMVLVVNMTLSWSKHDDMDLGREGNDGERPR